MKNKKVKKNPPLPDWQVDGTGENEERKQNEKNEGGAEWMNAKRRKEEWGTKGGRREKETDTLN